jgi:hypothetical protein
MLSANTKAPEMAKTAVCTNLLEAFKVVAQLGVNTVGQNLQVLAVDDVTLTVQEP